MPDFDNRQVDEALAPVGAVKFNFLDNIGHGKPNVLFSGGSGLSFQDACHTAVGIGNPL